jgi:hypothetical protein
MKSVSTVVTVLIIAPIWYYLVYVCLSAAHPDRLVWFLFWIYVPLGLIFRIVDAVIAHNEVKSALSKKS